MADGKGLTQFELLQLVAMNRMAECGDGRGGGSSVHYEIRSQDVLLLLMIFAEVIGFRGDVAGYLPEVIQRFRSSPPS